MSNARYYGDDLAVTRGGIAPENIDLICLAPPFNSNACCNVPFKAASGAGRSRPRAPMPRFGNGLLRYTALCWIIFSAPAGAITQIVTSTNDSGAGSLRDAINQANLLGGNQQINFAIAGASKTICPLTPLPPLTTPTLINGWTQPGYAGRPLIELDGSCAGQGHGLEIKGGASVVRGLVINRWVRIGIYITGPGGNAILGNFIGTDATGKLPRPNTYDGVRISASNDNWIGGTTTDGINLLSGNGNFGVNITDGGTRNSIIHNLIGTDIDGAFAIPNAFSGYSIFQSPGNTIGGAGDVYRNIISGNSQYGGMITGPLASRNLVIGNYVGTDITGLAAIPNIRTGLLIFEAGSNTIGGATAGERNVISGNTRAGINIDGSAFGTQFFVGKGYTKLNRVIGNFIGVNKNGTAALPNGLAGVRLYKAQQNTVGGEKPGEGNVISGNAVDGIQVLGEPDHGNPNLLATRNWVLGNKIGTDLAGNPIPNLRTGILIYYGRLNHVGGTTPAAGNTIKFNKYFGYMSIGPDYSTNSGSAYNNIQANLPANVHFAP